MVVAMNPIPVNRLANFLLTLLTAVCFAAGYVSAQTPDQDQGQTVINAVESTQDFALFEAVETTASNRSNSPARRNRESRATVAEPEFTLVGVTRIGDKYSAIVRHKSGEALIVRADPAGNTRIPDYEDYSIVNVGAGSISIRYPGNNPCVEFSDLGVSCSGAANGERWGKVPEGLIFNQ